MALAAARSLISRDVFARRLIVAVRAIKVRGKRPVRIQLVAPEVRSRLVLGHRWVEAHAALMRVQLSLRPFVGAKPVAQTHRIGPILPTTVV